MADGATVCGGDGTVCRADAGFSCGGAGWGVSAAGEAAVSGGEAVGAGASGRRAGLAMGETRGKTECWYVLEAEPGAAVALGLKDGADAATVKAAVADGTMESLMEWVPVSVGDMLFVDAGTVHAIGPGVVLLETQQTSDVTYRLYDYGRPRELHLEKGLQVMRPKTAAGKVAAKKMDGFTRLIDQKYFLVDRFDFGEVTEASVSFDGTGMPGWTGWEGGDLNFGGRCCVDSRAGYRCARRRQWSDRRYGYRCLVLEVRGAGSLTALVAVDRGCGQFFEDCSRGCRRTEELRDEGFEEGTRHEHGGCGFGVDGLVDASECLLRRDVFL